MEKVNEFKYPGSSLCKHRMRDKRESPTRKESSGMRERTVSKEVKKAPGIA